MDLLALRAILTLDKKDYEEGLDESQNQAKSFSDKVKGAFGVATKAGAALSAGALAAGGAIYGMATKSAATSDRIDKMSQKLGLSRKAFQELDFIASQSGTSVEAMKGGMKTLTAQMNKAMKGGKDSAAAFSKLGVSVTDANGELKDQETVLFETMEALQNMEDGTEKATLATQLLGRSGTELMPLLNGAAGSIDEMRQQANDLGLVLGDDTIDAGVKFTDTVDQVQRSLSAIGTEIGAQVMPIVQRALEFVLQNMPKIQQVASTVFTALGSFVTTFVSLINTYVIPVISGLVSFVTNIFTGNWSAAWEQVKSVFTSIWSTISDFFAEKFNDAVTAIGEIEWGTVATDIFTKIQNGLADVAAYFQALFTVAKGFIESIDWAGVGTFIWDKIQEFATGVYTWFEEEFTEAKTAIESVDWAAVGTFIWDAISGVFLTAWETMKAIFEVIAGTIKGINWAEVGSFIWSAIKAAFNFAIKYYSSLFTLIAAIIKRIDWAAVGTFIWNAIKAAFNGAVKIMQGIFLLVVAAIRNIQWAELGKAMWEKIKAAFEAISAWFSERFEDAKATILSINWTALGTTIWIKIRNAFTSIATWFKNKFDAAKNAILNLSWSDLGSSIMGKIKEALGAIKDWFTGLFDWSNIHIKMPHITVTGWNNIGPLKIPTGFGVEWKKKAYTQPLMFTSPTVIPTMSGLQGFGDGVGGEIIMSERKLRQIAGGEQMAGAIYSLADSIDDLSDSLVDKMVYALDHMGFNIDGREFARLVRSV